MMITNPGETTKDSHVTNTNLHLNPWVADGGSKFLKAKFLLYLQSSSLDVRKWVVQVTGQDMVVFEWSTRVAPIHKHLEFNNN